MADLNDILWTPSAQRIAGARITAFRRRAEGVAGMPLADTVALHQWSVADRAAFWSLVWDETGLIGEKGGIALAEGGSMRADRFFPEAKLNFAENLLRQAGEHPVMIFRAEDRQARTMTADGLRALVSRLQQALAAAGIGPGDRVAAMVPNMPETVAAMLAVTSIGAVWSSCSPDFGIDGVMDRFGQIAPKVFFACDGYWYNGKWIDVSDKAAAVASRLGVTLAVELPLAGTDGPARAAGFASLSEVIAPHAPSVPTFARLPFDHPLFILFSSGTTGIPKCIVHSAGGTLIQHLKEHQLHADIRAGDRVFYFTTCGWMMWNWLVTALASGATLLLFDGSPFSPSGNVLFDFADETGMTYFGTSAKFIDSVRKAGLRPCETHSLANVRTISSTGSPLAPENFRFVHEAIKADVHLASISGGTDIVSCFVLGDPTRPVRIGEIQGPGLGMAVDVFDENGRPVRGEKGELVCTKAFPSMPVGFFNDPGGEKYSSAYFERFDGIWCHGDFAEWTPAGGMVIHGRSDATLNPGGVRIGTAEIYNVVERLDEIAEAICIGQDHQGDVRVVLFVRLAEGQVLDDALRGRIRAAIRAGASPRHVPAVIVAVDDIPRTKSGKITELAVRDVVHGRIVRNVHALANPEALAHFRDRPELA